MLLLMATNAFIGKVDAVSFAEKVCHFESLHWEESLCDLLESGGKICL